MAKRIQVRDLGLGSGLGPLVHLGCLRHRDSLPAGLWYPGGWGFVLLLVPLAALNGLVHLRLLTNRPVT